MMSGAQATSLFRRCQSFLPFSSAAPTLTTNLLLRSCVYVCACVCVSHHEKIHAQGSSFALFAHCLPANVLHPLLEKFAQHGMDERRSCWFQFAIFVCFCMYVCLCVCVFVVR